VREPNAHRAEFAASLGAEPVSAEAAASASFSVVIEASGKDAARQLALEAVAPGGAVVQLGESDAWNLTETRSIRRKDFFLIRSFYFPLGEYGENIEFMRADREDYTRLVDEVTPLDKLEALFGAFARGERIKPLLCPA
jgi:L-iditol 2-dehydrogenase